MNGKICYIEMPTTDVGRSADFYAKVFGWNVRRRGDGSTAFDDTTGQVSGAWRLGRPASEAPGLLIYIMVTALPQRARPSLRTEGRSCSPSAVILAR